MKVSGLKVLAAVLLLNTQVLAADLIQQLPLRCQRVAENQTLDSPSYLETDQSRVNQRRTRSCRTIARKNYIRSGSSTISNQRNATTLPPEITLNENQELHLLAEEDPEQATRNWYLWTFKYRGKVFFSTDENITIQFPDNATVLLRLWIRNRATGKVEKHISKVRILNSAPAAKIKSSSNISTTTTATFQAEVDEPGPTDKEAGFIFLWNVDGKSPATNETTAATFRHRFASAGTHTISLQVTDKDGGSTFVQKKITVEQPDSTSQPPAKAAPKPTAIPTAIPTTAPTAAPTPRPTPPPAAKPTARPTPVPAPVPPTNPGDPAPLLGQWESQMIEYGRKHCALLADSSASADQRLGTTYYDAQWVFYQIADYTGDASWTTCAQHAERAYRDGYAADWDGRVAGYWNFTHGLLTDYVRTGDTQSRDALIQISKSAAYATDGTPLDWTTDAELSREVAYAIMSYLNAEKAGAPRRARLASLYAQARGHMEQWFTHESTPYMRPFMAALTSQALIEYDEWIGDPEIVAVVKKAMDTVWEKTWLPEQQTFQYTDRPHETGGTEPAYDLNLLIAPAYAWLYKETGEQKYRDRADQIFAGGVKSAWLANGKQFNQNFRWSFHYLRWRQ